MVILLGGSSWVYGLFFIAALIMTPFMLVSDALKKRKARREREKKERRAKEEARRKKHLEDIELQAFRELVRSKSAQMDEKDRRNFDWDAMSKQFKLEHGVSGLFPHELFLAIFPILYPDNFKYPQH